MLKENYDKFIEGTGSDPDYPFVSFGDGKKKTKLIKKGQNVGTNTDDSSLERDGNLTLTM
jgi:hypothetical protein